jgi:hypothetical protein
MAAHALHLLNRGNGSYQITEHPSSFDEIIKVLGCENKKGIGRKFLLTIFYLIGNRQVR